MYLIDMGRSARVPSWECDARLVDDPCWEDEQEEEQDDEDEE